MITLNQATSILADMIGATGGDEVTAVTVQNRTITWEMKDGQKFKAVVSEIREKPNEDS